MTYFCDAGVEIPSSITKREHTEYISLKIRYIADSTRRGKTNRELCDPYGFGQQDYDFWG